jgi:hypothetical protein
MLRPYNILFPGIEIAIKDDPYMISATGTILGQNRIIDDNINRTKAGTITIPCIIKDRNSNTFYFEDGLGNEIFEKIIGYNSGSGWVASDFEGDIPNTEQLYSEKGKVIYLLIEIEPVVFNKTLTGSLETDGIMLTKKYYDRLEFIYNSRLGATMVKQDEEVQSIDIAAETVTTDYATYNIKYPASIQYSVGDTVPAYDFIDKVCSLEMEPPYVKIILKKEYSYLRKIFTFDSNRKIELID